MLPPLDAEAAVEPLAAPRRLPRWAAAILWPSFLMAGVLEMLVFAVVDPGELHASRQALYTIAFLVFWGAISTAGALTALLMVETD